jgi:xylose isomerase
VSIQAAGDARVAQLSVPTLAAGESYDDLLADRSAFEDFDADAAGRRGLGAVHLTQLAVEHLLGAR